MKNLTHIIVLALCVLAVSCKSNRGQSTEPADSAAPAVTASPADPFAVLDSLKVSEPYQLCRQELTSDAGIDAAFKNIMRSGVTLEATSERYAFYIPERGAELTDFERRVMMRYNHTALFNKVRQGSELFERLSFGGEDTPATRKDTLRWLAGTCPKIPFIKEIFPGSPKCREAARSLLGAYLRSEGEWSGDQFEYACREYGAAKSECPSICPEETREQFSEGFWDRYDKARLVPEIDDIIRLNLSPDIDTTRLAAERLEHFRSAVLSERDIDRRTVLALEYAKFDCYGGALLLGEILESGQYTEYLLEAWLSWRAHLQFWHSPSSFSIIPNNYFDRMRVMCIRTLLKHYEETLDPFDLCWIENFIQARIMHRMTMFGNESLMITSDLEKWQFIHPRITGKDYLKKKG